MSSPLPPDPPARKKRPKKAARALAPKENERPIRAPIAELVTGAAWLLGLGALLAIGDGLLQRVPIARATLGALATSVALGRAGVVWDEADPEGKSAVRPLLLSLQGALRSATAALPVIAIAGFAKLARIDSGHIDLSMLLAILTAVAMSIREELLFRAVPFHFAMRAFGGSKNATLGVTVFAALLSPTAFLLTPGTTVAALALAASLGLLAARLRARTGSIYGPIASTFAAHLVLGPTLQSSLLSVTWDRGEATMTALASGAPAWIACGLVTLIAIVGMPRAGGPSPSNLAKPAALPVEDAAPPN